MKIRVMGTKEECNLAQDYYRAMEKEENVNWVEVSQLYPNRGSSSLYRVYIEISYKWIDDQPSQNSRLPSDV